MRIGIGKNNNSVLYATPWEKENKVTYCIFYGVDHKAYTIDWGETDLYLGKVNGVRYYFNLNNGGNEVYCNHPFTGEVQLLPKYEQNQILKAIICKH